MGYYENPAYIVFLGWSGANLLDSTTYYGGNIYRLPSTTANLAKVFIPRTGIIRKIYLSIVNTNDASDEDTTIYLRKNNTSDTSIYVGSIGDATNVNFISNTSLNINTTAGDYFELKMVTPAFATNPTGTSIWGYLYIEI